MRRIGTIAGAALMTLALAACGTSAGGGPSSAAAVHEMVTSAAPTASASAPAITSSTHPLSYYASEYVRIVAPGNAALDKMSAAANAKNPSLSQVQSLATAAAKIAQSEDAQLLRIAWPSPTIAQDVRSLVKADGPVIGDLDNIEGSQTTLYRDDGAANAAANIVRADLGLKPAS